MSTRRDILIGLIAAMQTMLAGANAQAAAGTEARCSELGANCVCSEPMQASLSVTDGNIDFPDSPDATECQKPWLAIGGDGSGSTMSVAGQTGWGTAQWAYNHGWNNGADKNQNNWLAPTVPNVVPFTSANRSWCVRYYRQFDNVYQSAGANAGTCFGSTVRNKLLQTGHTGGTVFQVQEDGDGGDCVMNPSKNIIAGYSGGATNGSLSPAITFDSCDDAPCRIEMCADGPLKAGGTLTWRVRIVSLEPGGKTGLFTRTETAGAAAPNIQPWGGDINHSQASAGGSREAYFMSAVWDNVDSTRWIGPASEIEGGGSTPPPPPPPVAPPAPVLLP